MNCIFLTRECVQVGKPTEIVHDSHVPPTTAKGPQPKLRWFLQPDVQQLPTQARRGALGSCAVVGNSETLLQFPRGKEIDMHDTVVRFGFFREAPDVYAKECPLFKRFPWMCPPPAIEYSKLQPVYPDLAGVESYAGSKTTMAYMQERVVVADAEQAGFVPTPEMLMMQTWSSDLVTDNRFAGIHVLSVSGRGWEQLVHVRSLACTKHCERPGVILTRCCTSPW